MQRLKSAQVQEEQKMSTQRTHHHIPSPNVLVELFRRASTSDFGSHEAVSTKDIRCTLRPRGAACSQSSFLLTCLM